MKGENGSFQPHSTPPRRMRECGGRESWPQKPHPSLLDAAPALENVWLVGGGSGHGYKHGPVLGEYVARRVTGQDKSPELETVFRLKAQTFPGGAS